MRETIEGQRMVEVVDKAASYCGDRGRRKWQSAYRWWLGGDSYFT